MADAKGQCSPALCVAPSLNAGHLWRVKTVALLPYMVGCDLDEDGDPDNVLGKLNSLYGGVAVQMMNATDASGVALIHWDCASPDIPLPQAKALWQSPESCSPTISWLPVPVSDATPLPVAVSTDTWVNSGEASTCAARVRLARTDAPPANSAPIQIPITLPIVDSPLLPIPVLRPTYAPAGPTRIMVCGAVQKSTLQMIIKAIPADIAARYGGSAQLATLVSSLFSADMDLDEDGMKDGISIAVEVDLESFDPKNIAILPTGLSAPVTQTEAP